MANLAKFKVGETIKYRGDIYKITGINETGYDVIAVDFTDAEETCTGIGFCAEDRITHYDMSEFDFDHAYEVCPFCEEEVMLDPELKVQTCPNCGRRIVTCSMCRACDSGEDYCSKCCLSYQAEMENAEQENEETRMNTPEHQFGEVRCDYFDDLDGVWCVDAWKTPDDDEGGFVVAKINPDTLEVTYTDREYAKDKLVYETVASKLKEILKDKSDTLARDLQL